MTKATVKASKALTPDVSDAVALVGFVADPDTFVATDAMAETIKAQVALSTKAGNAAMYNGGLFVYSVVKAGEVGEGKRFKTQEAVINALGHTAKGYATLLRNLGEAADRHGVKFGTPEWGHLCSAMGGSWDESKALRETVKGTKAGFKKALTASRKAETVRAKAPKGLKGRGPNRQGGGKQTAGKGGTKAPAKAPAIGSMGDALQTVALLERYLKASTTTPTAAKRVEAAMLKAVAGSRDKREVAPVVKGEVIAG
jgi:hypothetical protein